MIGGQRIVGKLIGITILAALVALSGALLLGPELTQAQSGPTVTGVAVTSTPASGDTYGPDEVIG